MTIYLAGGYSGNLKPAWKLAARTDASADGFIRGLCDAGFWQGGSHATGYMRLRP